MTILKFTDGMKFDLSGSLRKEHREDGWYIVGEGRLHAEKDEASADKFLSEHSQSSQGIEKWKNTNLKYYLQ